MSDSANPFSLIVAPHNKDSLEMMVSVLRRPTIQQILEDKTVLFCAQWPPSMCLA